MTKQLEKSQEQKKEENKKEISFCKENVGRRFLIKERGDLREFQLLEISPNNKYVKVEWRDALCIKWHDIGSFGNSDRSCYMFVDILEDLRPVITSQGSLTVTSPSALVQLKETENKS